MRYLKSFADNNNLHLMESKIIKFSHRYRLLEQKVVKDFPKSGSDGEKIAIKQDNDKYWIYKWDENEKIKNYTHGLLWTFPSTHSTCLYVMLISEYC